MGGRRHEAVASGRALTYFDGKGSPMKEWVALADVPADDAPDDIALTREALEFVSPRTSEPVRPALLVRQHAELVAVGIGQHDPAVRRGGDVEVQSAPCNAMSPVPERGGERRALDRQVMTCL